MSISLLATEILFNLKTIWKYGMNPSQMGALVKHVKDVKKADEEVMEALNELYIHNFIECVNGIYYPKE